MENIERTRNFCIIAHIDHGKSTLADRLLDATDAVPERERMAQILDTMELERERGITIKAQAVKLLYNRPDGEWNLNLIDTPGHVDFAYEVSRAIAACEGALLVVDAGQGIQAQTLANLYLAMEHDLEIIPVVNKIDLPAADVPAVTEELVELLGVDEAEVLKISAKTGEGIDKVLDAVVETGFPRRRRHMMRRGRSSSTRTMTRTGASFRSRASSTARCRRVMSSARWAVRSNSRCLEVGCYSPKPTALTGLQTGEVGYVIAGLKDIEALRVGDTVTRTADPAFEPLPGYDRALPTVFSGLYPTDGDDFEQLRDALAKLQLNDASLFFEPENSRMGFGFRCGFLGLLHMEIVQERLEREFGLDLIASSPSVKYEVVVDGETIEVTNPSELPEFFEEIREPVVRATIISPKEYVGAVMSLCHDRRGVSIGMEYISTRRVQLTYDLPLAEIITDFFDALKSRTRGYASYDYEPRDYEASDLVKVEILVSGDTVDALSFIVHRDKAYQRGRALAEKLRELIPRQQFEVPVQAAVGKRIIARETVRAYRKDVTAKCYGGDITRKRKLLERQKAGKRRMKQVGNVEIPQEAFLAALRI